MPADAGSTSHTPVTVENIWLLCNWKYKLKNAPLKRRPVIGHLRIIKSEVIRTHFLEFVCKDVPIVRNVIGPSRGGRMLNNYPLTVTRVVYLLLLARRSRLG